MNTENGEENPNAVEMEDGEAEDIITSIINGDRDLWRTQHFWDDPKERKLTIQDVFRVLRNHVISQIERDEEHGNFRVRLDGKVDGGPLRVVLGLRRVGPCSLITVFRPRHGKKK